MVCVCVPHLIRLDTVLVSINGPTELSGVVCIGDPHEVTHVGTFFVYHLTRIKKMLCHYSRCNSVHSSVVCLAAMLYTLQQCVVP